jgi:predicted alternative tryptophan synthase beta-subunit
MNLIVQEVSAEPEIEIPEAVRDPYRLWRPTPLYEPAHAIRAVIEEADAAREAGEQRVILFGLCGHGKLRPERVRRLPGRQAGGS